MAGQRGGSKRGPRCHHIIHKKKGSSRQKGPAARVDGNGPLQRFASFFAGHPLKRRRMPRPAQQIRAPGPAQHLAQGLGQKRGLIETPPQEPAPVQGNGRDQTIFGGERMGSLPHPTGCGRRDLLPVPVLERENQLATGPPVEQCRASLDPGRRGMKAAVTVQQVAVTRPRQGSATGIADGTTDKGRLSPTGGTKALVTFDKFTAGKAPRRIDGIKRHLKPGDRQTTSPR